MNVVEFPAHPLLLSIAFREERIWIFSLREEVVDVLAVVASLEAVALEVLVSPSSMVVVLKPSM